MRGGAQRQGREGFAEEFDEGDRSPAAACADKKTEEDTASEAIKDSGLITFGRFTASPAASPCWSRSSTRASGR